MAVASRITAGMFETTAQEIAERLRAVGVAAFRDEVVHFRDEVVVDRDRQALHALSPRQREYDEFELTSHFLKLSVLFSERPPKE
jgi:hypothetical protein